MRPSISIRVPAPFRVLLLSSALLGLVCPSCSGSADPGSAGSAGSQMGGVDGMRAGIEALFARAEHEAPVVEVQHVLISFAGAPRMTGVTRTVEEAEVIAADVLDRVNAGEEFATLVDQFSDDPGRPGIYVMIADSSLRKENPGASLRNGMVGAFGDVGWRLKAGEVGVAPHDSKTSPFGWHIIKRLR